MARQAPSPQLASASSPTAPATLFVPEHALAPAPEPTLTDHVMQAAVAGAVALKVWLVGRLSTWFGL